MCEDDNNLRFMSVEINIILSCAHSFTHKNEVIRI